MGFYGAWRRGNSSHRTEVRELPCQGLCEPQPVSIAAQIFSTEKREGGFSFGCLPCGTHRPPRAAALDARRIKSPGAARTSPLRRSGPAAWLQTPACLGRSIRAAWTHRHSSSTGPASMGLRTHMSSPAGVPPPAAAQAQQKTQPGRHSLAKSRTPAYCPVQRFTVVSNREFIVPRGHPGGVWTSAPCLPRCTDTAGIRRPWTTLPRPDRCMRGPAGQRK